MKSSMRIFLACSLVTSGYFLGNLQIFRAAQAQTEEAIPSDEAIRKIRDAHVAMKAAIQQLKVESKYESVTKGVNPFAILVGGINVKDDLESGHGIDPESYAALSVAIYDIKKNHLKDESLADWVDPNLFNYDANGRLTYRDKVLRIYSISKLRRLNAQRQVVLEDTKASK